MDRTWRDGDGLQVFLLSVFVLGWGVQLALLFGGVKLEQQVGPQLFHEEPNPVAPLTPFAIGFVTWLPGLVALSLATLLHGGGDGSFRIHLPLLRFGPAKPYMTVAMSIPFVFCTVYAASLLAGFLSPPEWSLSTYRSGAESRSLPVDSAHPLLVIPLLLLTNTVLLPLYNLVYQLLAELGWRCFLLPRITRRFYDGSPHGRWKVNCVMGLLWSLYHLPMLLMGAAYNVPDGVIAGIWRFIILTAFSTTWGAYLNEMALRHRSSTLTAWMQSIFESHSYGVLPLLFPGAVPLIAGPRGAVAAVGWGVVSFVMAKSGASFFVSF